MYYTHHSSDLYSTVDLYNYYIQICKKSGFKNDIDPKRFSCHLFVGGATERSDRAERPSGATERSEGVSIIFDML